MSKSGNEVFDKEHSTIIREALVSTNWQWPNQLTSGVMFYKGHTIVFDEYINMAKKLKRNINHD